MKWRMLLMVVPLAGLGLTLSAPARAVGCLSGGVAGAVAGHMVHHGVLGAVGGCVAGHEYNKHQQRAAESRYRSDNGSPSYDRNGPVQGDGYRQE
jgi:outer membrane lipoprotein SlyB